jgi:hypothetical protein
MKSKFILYALSTFCLAKGAFAAQSSLDKLAQEYGEIYLSQGFTRHEVDKLTSIYGDLRQPFGSIEYSHTWSEIVLEMTMDSNQADAVVPTAQLPVQAPPSDKKAERRAEIACKLMRRC